MKSFPSSCPHPNLQPPTGLFVSVVIPCGPLEKSVFVKTGQTGVPTKGPTSIFSPPFPASLPLTLDLGLTSLLPNKPGAQKRGPRLYILGSQAHTNTNVSEKE